jgi:N-acetylmuramoyl-L-alanine amidase
MKFIKRNKSMEELIRKIFLSVLILFFLGFGFGISSAKETMKTVPVKVVLDDDTVLEGVNVLLITGVGFISADDISKIFNTTTSWQSVSEKVSLKLGTEVIEFPIDTKEVIINGQSAKMGKAARLIDGTVMIPLEFLLTDTFGKFIAGKLIWDYDKKILTLTRDYNISDIRVRTHPKYTRIVFDERQELKYSLSKGDAGQLVVTIYHGILKNKDYKLTVNDGRIKDIVAEQNKRDIRLTINLGDLFEDYKDFDLANPNRIVIDITGGEIAPVAQTSGTNENAFKKPVSVQDTVPVPVGITEQPSVDKTDFPSVPAVQTNEDVKQSSGKNIATGMKIRTIVIDAGHGGKDPGAIGHRGTKEKDIVLDVAKRLASMLEKVPGTKIILTRKGDYFIPLDERTNIANINKADLFISIHANASLSRKLTGFEAYFLSERASDKEAEAVANIENSVINLESDHPKDNLSVILWSMTLNEFMNESSEVCSIISREVPGNVGIECRGVKQAGFYVLRNAKMPAVLIEIGFLTNLREELQMKNRTFREKIAKSIFNGVMKYKQLVER